MADDEIPTDETGDDADDDVLVGLAGIEPIEIEQEMERSFLDYSMSVIVSRALPDVRDGLKPVHRRILWGMHDVGARPDRPFMKCARVTGEVMGKYHPHGDLSIYMALVRMAQDFALRHPLVAGHGNFGSPDFGPAAARYTECRLAPLAMHMMSDIDEDTVDFTENYSKSAVAKKHDTGVAANVVMTEVNRVNTGNLPVIVAGDMRYLREPFGDVSGFVEAQPTFIRGGYYDAMAAQDKNGFGYSTFSGRSTNQPRSSSGVGARSDYVLLKGFRGSQSYTNVFNWSDGGLVPSDHNLVYADVMVPFLP